MEGKQGTLPFPEECHDAESVFAVTVPSEPLHTLHTVALLSSIVGHRAEERCRQLLNLGDLRTVAQLLPAELAALGFTPVEVGRLGAVFELARRYGEIEWTKGAPFRGSYDVYAHFRERLAQERAEHFICILLDNKNRKMKEILVSKGSLTASVVHPREVYAPVIRESAAAVILLHNHPSGDPTPSAEDIEITRRLREVGDLIGIRVLDHIIVGHGRYVSFVDDGFW